MKINGEALPVEAYEVEAKGLTIKSPPAGTPLWPFHSYAFSTFVSCWLLLLLGVVGCMSACYGMEAKGLAIKAPRAGAYWCPAVSNALGPRRLLAGRQPVSVCAQSCHNWVLACSLPASSFDVESHRYAPGAAEHSAFTLRSPLTACFQCN